ncbi:MAG: hypothetical protein PHV06_11655, partial [bacterium]|nr:hypothetical protein [bacterium]
MSRKFAIGILFIFICISSFGSWSIPEIIDGPDSVGKYPSLKVDAWNGIHISYFDNSNTNLKYAVKLSTSWETEIVDNSGDVGYYSSIAVDSNNLPHIAYYSAFPDYNLKYSYWDGTKWQIETVDSDLNDVGQCCSITLDQNDYPLISYLDATNRDLKLARFDGIKWNFEIVDSTGMVGQYTDIEIDSSNRIHISYTDYQAYNLKYALFNSSTWIITTVDSTGIVGEYTSLALDSNNNPKISYKGAGVQYADFNGSEWKTAIVDPKDYTGLYTSLVLDTEDNPKISYYDWEYEIPKFAFFVNNFWLIQNIDNVIKRGEGTSIDLLSSGEVVVAYHDYQSFDILLSKFTEGEPVISWTGNEHYENDGVNPDTGYTGEVFIFKINYFEENNIPPMVNYPKVNINSNSVSGSFTMLESNSDDTDFSDGKEYFYPLIFNQAGNSNYYSFSAYDQEGTKAVGEPNDTKSGPIVIENNPPELQWLNITGYISDGLEPEQDILGQTFTFKILYSDSDNHPPHSEFPKVLIGKNDFSFYDNKKLIESNPLDNNYSDGKEYFIDYVFPVEGTFTYFFLAKDICNLDATGDASENTKSGPVVINNPPVLTWTGNEGFTENGIDPDNGAVSEKFKFRIIYSDPDNHAPETGYPKIEIFKDGIGLPGNPFIMSEVDVNDNLFSDGKEFLFNKSFSNTGNYSHKFIAFDSYHKAAEGPGTTETSLPIVYFNDNPELTWLLENGYNSDGVNPDKALYIYEFLYKINYYDKNNDQPAEGYPKVHILKDGKEIKGSPFSMTEADENDSIFSDGKIYCFKKKFDREAQYSYFFESFDYKLYEAIGDPVYIKLGPEVIFPETSEIIVAPNPVRLCERNKAQFLNIPPGSELNIYTIDGSKIFSIIIHDN